nr:hypothetical protein [Cressdnaviricota sp.]
MTSRHRHVTVAPKRRTSSRSATKRTHCRAPCRSLAVGVSPTTILRVTCVCHRQMFNVY